MDISKVVNGLMLALAVNSCSSGYAYKYEKFTPTTSPKPVYISTKIENTLLYTFDKAPRELPICLKGHETQAGYYITDGIIPPILSATDSGVFFDIDYCHLIPDYIGMGHNHIEPGS